MISPRQGTGSEQREHVVEVAGTDVVAETRIVHIADVVIEYAVVHPVAHVVVGAEVTAQEGVADVAGIVLLPTPFTRRVERGVDVHMAVAQLRQHLAEHFEKLGARHPLVHTGGIAGVHLVPVQAYFCFLVVQKAVMLIDDAPQGIEVALRRVGKFILIHAARHRA